MRVDKVDDIECADKDTDNVDKSDEERCLGRVDMILRGMEFSSEVVQGEARGTQNRDRQ